MVDLKNFGINSRTLLSGIFVVVGAFAAYSLFNAVIGGTCDSQCGISALNQAIRYAAPVALAAYCGLMCKRAAVINIGIEGMMLMGAMVGYGVNMYAFTAMKSGGIYVITRSQRRSDRNKGRPCTRPGA